MSRFTRLTIVGSRQRAEVVVPSDEPFASMLAPLLDLLEEMPGTEPETLCLVRITGDQVEGTLGCQDQGLGDGEVLRLVRIVDAPPPPEVVDVTDATTETFLERPGLWNQATRHTVAATTTALGAAVSSLILVVSTQSPTAIAWWLIGGPTLALVAAGLLQRGTPRYSGTILTVIAVGLAPAAGLASVLCGWFTPYGGLFLAMTLGWAALGAGVGVGRRDRGALAGACVGLAFSALLLSLDLALDPVDAASIVAVSALAICGMLPWYAMTSSGLTGLDDLAVDGTPPQRSRVRATLEDSYKALTWSAVAVAGAVTIPLIVLATSPSALDQGLALVAVAVLALRTRSFPLRWQAIALWAAVAITLTAYAAGPLAGRSPTLAAASAAAIAIVAAIAAGLRPSGQQRARLRRLGDTTEALCMIAVVPLVLARWGVFTTLLGTFS